LTGDGGLEAVAREGGRELGREDDVPVSYASLTVTLVGDIMEQQENTKALEIPLA